MGCAISRRDTGSCSSLTSWAVSWGSGWVGGSVTFTGITRWSGGSAWGKCARRRRNWRREALTHQKDIEQIHDLAVMRVGDGVAGAFDDLLSGVAVPFGKAAKAGDRDHLVLARPDGEDRQVAGGDGAMRVAHVARKRVAQGREHRRAKAAPAQFFLLAVNHVVDAAVEAAFGFRGAAKGMAIGEHEKPAPEPVVIDHQPRHRPQIMAHASGREQHELAQA